jgi:hypothetical protein
MIIYSLILLPFITSLLNDKFIKRASSLFGFLLIVFFAGLRYNTGNDYASYFEIYISKDPSNYETVEPGYILLNLIFNYLQINFSYFLLLFTYTIIIVFWNGFKKENSKKFHQLIFFFLLNDLPLLLMSVIRQGLSAAILLNAVYEINNKKYFKFIIFVLIATSFHLASLIIGIIIYISFKIAISNQSSRTITKIFLLILLTLAIFNPISLIGFNLDKFDTYLAGEAVTDNNFFFGGYFIFKIAILYFHARYVYDEVKNSTVNIHFILLLFSVLINIIFYQFGEVNLRMNYFFDASLIIVSVNLFYFKKISKILKFTIGSIASTYFVAHYYKYLILSGDVFFDYQNYLFLLLN